jgi:AcrR family transcriptional regulator
LPSNTRTLLLDVTERLMLTQGYASVTSRRVAARAGVTAPLVHYYFPTLDDLFIAAFRRRAQGNLERLTEALQGDDPLQALWNYASDKTGVALTLEYLALANHRQSAQAEIAEVALQFRKVQLEAVSSVLARTDLDPDLFPPAGLLLIMTAVPTSIVLEEALGISCGHNEATMLVERYIEAFGGAPRHSNQRMKRRRKRA